MRPRLRERLFPGWVWRLPAEQHAIAVTFDDGPNPQTTPELLKALDRLGVPATMFVLGERCIGNEDILRECVAAGHSIGVHGFSHQSLIWHSSKWQMESIRRTEDMFDSMGVTFQRLFRPPHGQFNLATSKALSALQYRGVLWSQIVNDWVPQEVSSLESRLCKDLISGDIVLLHDAHLTTETMIQALPRLADAVARRGWRFVTLTSSSLPQPTHL